MNINPVFIVCKLTRNRSFHRKSYDNRSSLLTKVFTKNEQKHVDSVII